MGRVRALHIAAGMGCACGSHMRRASRQPSIRKYKCASVHTCVFNADWGGSRVSEPAGAVRRSRAAVAMVVAKTRAPRCCGRP